MPHPLRSIQRQVKGILIAFLFAGDLLALWLGDRLLSAPLNLPWVTAWINWIMQPLFSLPTLSGSFPWVQWHWIPLAIADLCPWLAPLLTTLNHAYGRVVALSVIFAANSLFTVATTVLLLVDIPEALALWVNRQRAAIAKRHLSRFMNTLATIDLDRLPFDDARLLTPIQQALTPLLSHEHAL